MSQFVEQCRREWKRLHVPDEIAQEMAADLQADLDAAAADGAPAEALLGTGPPDPRAFAASWARERGVGRQPILHRFNARAVGLAAAALLVVLLAAALAIRHETARHRSPSSPSTTVQVANVTVPDLLELNEQTAVQIAENSGLTVHVTERRAAARAGTVLSQDPPAGMTTTRGARLALTVAR